ncbi:nuclear pore complex protein NUP50A [Euphorbia lathyris]|uniref:nuclear pore complex protein NUP50A n=1 Tax=Euphorbia lathyris TaxID=212925 RepID=UPI003313DC75
MGDAENILPPSKKRAAGREITKDNPGLDDEGDSSEETGTFQKASDEVLASRRIVKVRRNQSSTAPSSNPFAGIRLVTHTEISTVPAASATEVVTATVKAPEDRRSDSGEGAEKGKVETGKLSEAKIEEPVSETVAEKEVAEDKQNNNVGDEASDSKAVNEKPLGDDKAENDKIVDSEEAESKKAAESDKAESEAKKDDGSEEIDPSADSSRLSSFHQLSSSQNAFTGLAGTGLSTPTFSFGSVSTDGSATGTSFGSLFGQKNEKPSFSFGLSTNGSSAVFNTTGSSIVSKNEGTGFPSMQEVSVETGEENEKVVFSADSALFEYTNSAWKERGKGELKVNVSSTGPERARLLMRARGNYRLILNASLYPDMKLTDMEKRGVTFACINSIGENKEGLSTFALKFKDGAVVEEFRAAVTAHKDKIATALKTPENSPKASEE